MVNSEGMILHKTGHDRGRIHDYEIFKNKHPTTPLQVENVLDLGYLGVQNDFPTVKSVLTFRKKRKKGELSDEEKKHNRRHSKLRVIVEQKVVMENIVSAIEASQYMKASEIEDITQSCERSILYTQVSIRVSKIMTAKKLPKENENKENMKKMYYSLLIDMNAYPKLPKSL